MVIDYFWFYSIGMTRACSPHRLRYRLVGVNDTILILNLTTVSWLQTSLMHFRAIFCLRFKSADYNPCTCVVGRWLYAGLIKKMIVRLRREFKNETLNGDGERLVAKEPVEIGVLNASFNIKSSLQNIGDLARKRLEQSSLSSFRNYFWICKTLSLFKAMTW